MLLGSKYQLLSMIAKEYKRHQNGMFHFKEDDFRAKFPREESYIELLELEQDGIVQRAGHFIKVDSNVWAKFFAAKLQDSIKEIGFNYNCSYIVMSNEIEFYIDEVPKAKFYLNFCSEVPETTQDVIDMCNLSSYDSIPIWLDLLNDRDLLIMFCKYLNNELNSLSNEDRISFSFFDGIPDEEFSEIYGVAIREYFQDGGFEVEDLSEEMKPLVKKMLKVNDYQTMEIRINDTSLVIAKIERKIEFLSFRDNQLKYNAEVLSEVRKLRNKLQKKVSQYRRITRINRHQVVDNVRKTVNVVTILLACLNTWALYAISKGVSKIQAAIQNTYFILALGIVQVFIVLAIFFFMVLPVIRLSIFSWKLHY